MAVKTLYFKEHEGIVHNPIGQLSSVPSMPWWNTFGSQSSYGESCALFKPSLMEQPPICEDSLTAMKQARLGIEQGLVKGNMTQFTIFPGNCKTSGDGQKSPQTAISLQTSLPEYRAHIDQGYGQPMIYAKYPHVDQCYGLFSSYGPQILGRIMLPMNMTTDDGPIFVNPKQYHGIIRRRKTRAKAVLLENKSTKKRKPYMHLSRHLHAMRRPRGTGGRFLNTKTSDNGIGEIEAKKDGGVKISQPTGSQSSEVLQSDSGTLNSSKEANGGGSNLSGSEVTSTYTRRDLDHFSINHLASPVQSFSVMMDSGHNNVMPSKWVAAADNCCNLKV
ncbi:hypothetical protein P3X46_004298 [Hevea brasiliensis]|uniref:Nuclear transcription factor Y subunit n=2 Tax=Hevea brasiliensis TaxID=3981 RepID=A0A6A6M3V8_HEVBR|nr:nuclear transcription factor Y subunit A-10 [Hevea brasiliensis]XP_021646171.1 nuclear transcription factor Y subunit A-10 [Hevea brasiliensis]KAF2308306.1 hypothetical protein GH714_039948 [Hevea brasiliensis]KAF2308307.1 hypothetical protein GH714_039949 [Hevea brasiliensis]KAF2308332.1 hypothetical protein GH714_040022 [Hevea brasiliensis]KAJ9184586.1 hypothetical protein P3X46_004298 [Hevea brasiliensis]